MAKKRFRCDRHGLQPAMFHGHFRKSLGETTSYLVLQCGCRYTKDVYDLSCNKINALVTGEKT